MKTLKTMALLGILVLGFHSIGRAETYAIDRAHSDVSFKIKHMVISKVRGSFDSFEGEIRFTPGDPASWSVEASIDAASINTGNKDRDDHLRNPDFFEVEKYPAITFKGSGAEEAGEGKYRLTGDLTMHGVTKPVTLDLEYLGSVQDPWGNQRAGFSASTVISRKDYGLTWSQTLETGGLVVGDRVEISIEIEGIAKNED